MVRYFRCTRLKKLLFAGGEVSVIVNDDEVRSVYTSPNQATVVTDVVTLPLDTLVNVGFTFDPDTHELTTTVTDLSDPDAPVTSSSEGIDANLPHPLSIESTQVGSVYNDPARPIFVDNFRVFNQSMDDSEWQDQAQTYGPQDDVTAYVTFDPPPADDDQTSGNSDDTPTMTIITEGTSASTFLIFKKLSKFLRMVVIHRQTVKGR